MCFSDGAKPQAADIESKRKGEWKKRNGKGGMEKGEWKKGNEKGGTKRHFPFGIAETESD